MQISERTVGDVTILDLRGRFVEERQNDFRDAVDRLVHLGCRKVLLNFDEVTYVDSAGLGMLVSKYVTLDRKEGKLKLYGLHPRSLRVLDITRLLTIFESFDSEAHAVASFAIEPPSDETGVLSRLL
jgi:anti-sigma B factor antagonist